MKLTEKGKTAILIQGFALNRTEVIQFLASFFAGLEKPETDTPGTDLKPFLDLVLSLKQTLPLSIPLLRDLAALVNGKTGLPAGPVKKRIDRRYARLCRLQEELGRLDLKKAAPGVTPEDYIFSRIDFSRYRKMPEEEFDLLFPAGLTDFDEAFCKKNFGLERDKIQSAIEKNYTKEEGFYKMRRDNPLTLSIMRTLDTSLETSPLFTAEEIREELTNLLDFTGGGKTRGGLLPGMEKLYRQLALSLNGIVIAHGDAMTTKLFISPQGDLSGTFRPGNKPWTLVLIPEGMLHCAAP